MPHRPAPPASSGSRRVPRTPPSSRHSIHSHGCGSCSASPSRPSRSSSGGGFARPSRDTRKVTERLALIDSNSLIYRALFAVPPLTTTKGELANAKFGYEGPVDQEIGRAHV